MPEMHLPSFVSRHLRVYVCAGMACAVLILFSVALFIGHGKARAAAPANTAVTTYRGNQQRTGWYNHESILNTSNVNANQFGKVASFPVDSKVYAQPLYVPGVQTAQGTLNLVFVATEHDSVYAFDADHAVTTAIWHTSFLINGATSVPSADVRSGDTVPEIGITGTPVIDPTTGTLYVSAMTKENGSYFQRLHALNIADGTERTNSPVIITASSPGNGGGSVNGVDIFNPLTQNQRSALTLLNGVVYIAYASFSDQPPYHGWLLGYDASTLQQVAVFNDSPNSQKGAGIWMSGSTLAVDPSDNSIYFSTGNGDSFNLDQGGTEGSQTVYHLSTPDLKQLDYFAPFNATCLNAINSEIGSAGVMIPPPQPGAHPDILITSGKEGRIYVLDRHNLGKYNTITDPCDNQNRTDVDQILQGYLPATVPGGMFGTPSYWSGPSGDYTYIEGTNGSIRQYPMVNGALSANPSSTSAETFDYPGGNVGVSSNGSTAGTGILWVIAPPASCQTTDHCNPSGASSLRAYDATNLGNELYSSSIDATRDQPGDYVKFTTPTIANGEVFVGTASTLDIFGLLPANQITPTSVGGTSTPLPTPTITPTPVPGTTSPFNNHGITDDTLMGTSNYNANFDLDGGSAYSNQALTQAGLVPGQPVTFDGATFTWPQIGATQNDNYDVAGQTLVFAPDANAQRIAFLGSASDGPSQGFFVVTFTDGTSQSFYLTFSDWCRGGSNAPLSAGNQIVAQMPYRDTPIGRQNLTTYVYYATVNLAAGKTVKYVGLPSVSLSGHLHIFAAALADTPSTVATPTPSPSPTATPSVTPTPIPSGSLPNYPNGFSSLSGLQVNANGGTTVQAVNNHLRLTDGKQGEQDSVYYQTSVPVSQFTSVFTFQMTNAVADGLTFVIQNSGLDALGPGGGNLGYTDIGNSVAVKFDLYDGATGAQISHTGLFTNGTAPETPDVDLAPLNFHSGDTFRAVLGYDGTTLTVTVTDTVTNQSATHSFTIDIPGTVGGQTAYAGFTAATGGLTSTQDILSWTYAGSTPNFPNGFSSVSGLQVNANAGTTVQTVNNHLRLTDGKAGEQDSVYFPATVPVGQFTSTFGFQMTNAVADGLTFVVQNTGLTALGPGGGNLGYTDIGKSVAVKFDLYDGATGAQVSHTGLFTNGTAPETPDVDLAPLNFHNGDAFQATLSYDGATLTVIVTDTVTNQSATHSFTIDIPGTVGGQTAYVGFTAATGGLTSTQDILSWTYTPNVSGGPAPTPTATSTPSATPTPIPPGSLPNFANGFSSLSGLQVNANTGTTVQTVNNHLRLTDGKQGEQDSVYFPATVPVGQFTTTFGFQMTNAVADGLTFVIQNSGLTALGPGGGNLGYTTISNSTAVKFNLYDGATGAQVSHTGLFTNGTAPGTPDVDLAPLNFHSGDAFQVTLSYNGTTLTETVIDTVTNQSATHSFTIDIPGTVGGQTAYAGFTAATGGLTSTQDILSWTYTNP